jgi:D-methionine transport system ATP-binding protein
MRDAETIIEIRGLYKRFGETTVLENINLEMEKGEIFGVVGRSGAGKSTLVRCINYLEKPSEGVVVYDGVPLSGLSPAELYRARRSMGMVFQQFNLLMQRTARDNICFPLEVAGWKKKDARARAMELLALVGLPDKAAAYPMQLSGGQRQRVAIARAIALNPKVLLCDEATSALDPETTQEVLALLSSINKQFHITIVVITHEMRVVETLCRRVAILDQSRVAETGFVRDVFTRPASAAGRRLVCPENDLIGAFQPGGRRCRVVFDGASAFEPFVADLVLHFRRPVNILFADTQNMEGRACGHMILQLPEEAETARGMLDYMRSRGLNVTEESAHV